MANKVIKESYLDKNGNFDTHKWVRKNTTPNQLDEGKYFDSDIMAKWNSEKSIRKDLAQYIANAYELGGEGDHDRGMNAVGDTITTFRKGIEDGVKMVKKMSK